MRIVHTSFLISLILSTSGCSLFQPPADESQEEPMTSVGQLTGPEHLFEDNNQNYMQEQMAKNQAAKMTRSEQIELAVEAAVSDRVEPILLSQPPQHTVYFTFSSSVVEQKWNEQLKQHVNYLSSDKSIRLLVAGFTDSKGSADFNLKLGQLRSNNVCKMLETLGARKEQLTCVSYGETHPADPGSSDEARARNRRVELLY
nr:OmpA/MotB [Vibrio alginolyticus]WKV19520.1 Outer membrane protein P6 [Vibrio parahaemolyticus]